MVVLRDQVAVLRRRWRIVALCMTIALGVALAAAYFQRPVYSATTSMLLAPAGATDDRAGTELLAQEEISTQIAVVRSLSVAKGVKRALRLPDHPAQLLDSTTVEQSEDQRVLSVTSRRASPESAADVANAFAEVYLAQRQTLASNVAAATMRTLQQRYAAVQDQLAAVQDQLASAADEDLSGLQSQENALTVQLTQLLQQLADADSVSSSSLDAGEVLLPAVAPVSPSEPKPVQLGLLGAMLGLVLGVGLAFVRDHFDDAVRDETRLRAALHHKPVLGRIPRWGNSRNGRLLTITDPHAPVSEAYRSLSSSVRFLLAAWRTGDDGGAGRGRRQVLLITSTAPKEGKTTVSSNLAVAAARFGLRVVLVDGDLRNPGVAQTFGLGDPPGLSDLLAEGDAVNDYLLDVGVPGLQVLAGGSVPPNPAELLASSRAGDVFDQLRTRADLVIVDSAPVTRVADTRELVPIVDLVLLVARHGQTRTRGLADAMERIHQVGGSVSGAVLNDVDSSGKDFLYTYGQAPDPAKQSRLNHGLTAAEARDPAAEEETEVPQLTEVSVPTGGGRSR